MTTLSPLQEKVNIQRNTVFNKKTNYSRSGIIASTYEKMAGLLERQVY